MKLLLHSNAPWAPTGYGSQVRQFAPLLAQHHDLKLSAFYGLEGARLNWDGIEVLPGLGGEFGNAGLVDHAAHTFGGDPKGGVVITLTDVWVLDPQMARRLNMACWVPVDHDPAPPLVREFFKQSGAVPLAMSRFAEEQLAEFDPIYVPHGVDIDTFKPQSRKEVREATGVDPNAFLIGMVAANKGRPSRKCFQEALEAFRIFRQRHENAQLYLHTTVDPNYAQGEDIGALMNSLELPDGSVLIADQYRQMMDPLPAALMARVYSTFDVLLNASAGEGFGVPIIEAQACGIPAIVTDFTAMKEVCGSGWKVGCRANWTGQKSWQAHPDVGAIVDALEECYTRTGPQRQAMAKKAREHASQYATAKVVTDHFLPALEAVAERFATPELSVVAA